MKTSFAYKVPGLSSKTVGISFYILDAVADHLKIPKNLILSKTRKREVVIARHITMWLYKKHTKYTLKMIGEMIGDNDHTTVLHAIRNVNNMIDTKYKTVSEDINQLEKILYG